MQLINISPTTCIGRAIFTFSVSRSCTTEDIHFNTRRNKIARVLITVGNIVFINKMMQNSIHLLSHIENINGGSVMHTIYCRTQI